MKRAWVVLLLVPVLVLVLPFGVLRVGMGLRAFRVPSSSMADTFLPGDYLLASMKACPAEAPGWIAPRDWDPFTVPEDKILLLGDNRDNSRDGRQMGFHPWRETPRGRVKRIYWSWDGEAKRPRWERLGRVPR